MIRNDLPRQPLLACSLAAALLSCTTAPDAMLPDDPAPEPFVLSFEPVDVAAGQELLNTCQSLTLGNTESIAVNAVRMDAGPAWHHANWFFVPESMYDGPDGTWNCRDRDFDTVAAGIAGSVLFAMSTQSQTEDQRFEPGAAIIIPPHSRIVGELHLINASDADISTDMALTVEPIRLSDVTAWLQPVSFVYYDLDIQPTALSEFSSECDLKRVWGGPLEPMSVHYVLPHYHGLGRKLRLEAFGGPMDGQLIYEAESAIGEPLGTTLDPPVDISAADGVRFSCTFENTGDTPVGWGLGDGEMCVVLAFVDSLAKFGGQVPSGSTFMGDADGIRHYQAPCEAFALLP